MQFLGYNDNHTRPMKLFRIQNPTLRRWLKPPRKIRATSTGKFVLLFTVVLGVAAVNTGNNLLYLILGSMFGLISASGILSERAMKGLQVERSLNTPLLAKQAASLRYTVTNTKSRTTAYLIELLEDPGNPGMLHDQISLQIPLFPSIAPGQSQRLSSTIKVQERGIYTFDMLQIQTNYPEI